jgi:predicted GIY-YIG superfamily endonuclease
MPSSFNPYYTPMQATPCSPFEQAKAHMLDRLSSHGRPDSTHITYLLAHARRATYYISVARDYREVYRFTRENCDQQRRHLGDRQTSRLRLVWCDEFHDEAEARQRCTELRALPHAWQRRLVDQFNPDWLDLDELLIGFPWLSCVGECGPTPFTLADE